MIILKFTKGIIIGSLLTAGALLVCAESDKIMNMNTKKMTKKGKQFAKKIGLI